MAEETKLSGKLEKLVGEIETLSVLELTELVEALQERLGVSQAAPVMASSAAGAAAPAGSEAGEEGASAPSTQTVVLIAPGANKISVIKALREIDPNLGLKEAKDLTEKLPAEILKDAKAGDAKAASEKLTAAGATVELK